MIDAYCTFPHYADWLAPILLALPAEARGELIADMRTARWLQQRWGLAARGGLPSRESLTLVAGMGDADRCGRFILVNHGAGQSYGGDERGRGDDSFVGGPGRGRAELIIEPSAAAAAADAAAHPSTRCEAAGPIPLDPWARGERPSGSGTGVVAFTSHHKLWAVPEQQPCLERYMGALGELGCDLLAHAHPRQLGRAAARADRLGCAWTDDFAVVLDRADALVVDNSSAGPLFAALGRPVIWLSSPDYRREVNHGGRFWEWVLDDPHVEEPEQLSAAVDAVLADRLLAEPRWPSQRLQSVLGPLCDGLAAERAAQLCLELL